MLVQIGDLAREDRLQMRVVPVAGGGGCAPLEERIKGPLSRSREAGEDVELRRGGRVEHHAADIRWEEPHHRERQAGPIGGAEQVDLPVAEGAHQVMHIVGILDRVVGIQVDPKPYQAVVAGAYDLQKRRVCHRGKFRAVQ